MRIGIINGGTSSEKRFSQANARAVCASLCAGGYEAELIDYDENMLLRLIKNPPELAFVCVQGKYHGDGTAQAILDFLHIPYVGSPAAAASLINDKLLCKLLFDACGIDTPAWYKLSRREYEDRSVDFGKIGYPFVAKAPSQGASVGIALVKNENELENIETAFEYDDPILAEAYIDGGAYTVGVTEKDGELLALPVVEMMDRRIDRKDGLQLMTGDYSGRAAELDGRQLEEMKQMALEIFRQTGARDYARIDFMVENGSGKVYAIEINAVPGLAREGSFLPMEAELMGISYDEFIESIVLNAGRRNGLC